MASTTLISNGFATADIFGGARRERQRAGRLTRRGRLLVTMSAGLVASAVLGLGVGRLAHTAAAEPVANIEPETISVVVEPGDSLWAIATRLNHGSDPRAVVAEIRERNHLRSNQIMPGDVLVVPLHS